MWNKPWTLKEGFAIGAGLIVSGLMLQLSVGPLVWEVFAWPANVIVLVMLIAAFTGMALLYNKVYAFRFLSSHAAAIPAMSYAVVLTIIMGLTAQTTSGTWLNNMLRFWPFVLIYLWMVVILALVVARRIWRLRNSFSFHDVAFLLNHAGLLIALLTATLGNPDMQRLKMICTYDTPEWRALDDQNRVVELPLAIELKQFIMEEYPDERLPKRFASDIQILTQTGKNIQATVEVNQPVEVEGWKIYQYGYNQQMGAMSDVSIFELVADPWLPAVYTGIYMMLAGALCLLLMGKKVKNKET